jgi:hypothetical protein
MILVPGALSLLDALRFVGGAAEAGGVFTAGGATVMTLDCGTVVQGDLILASLLVVKTKLVGIGAVQYSLIQSAGTATFTFAGGPSVPVVNRTCGLGEVWVESNTFMMRVTVGGTLTLGLNGLSQGGNSSGGNSALEAFILRAG